MRAVCVGLVLVVAAGCGFSGKGGGSDRECKVGSTVTIGDAAVTVESVRVNGFLSETPSGRMMNHDDVLIVTLKIRNTNPNRVLSAGSQAGKATAKDDVGNTYRTLVPKSDLGLESKVEHRIPEGKVRDVRSDRDTTDVVLIDRPVPGATNLTIRLDASAYGGTGTIVVPVTRTEWEPGAKK